MASLPLAGVAALAAWVGEDIAVDDARAGAVLSAASALVRSEAGLTWVDATVTPPVLGTVPDDIAAVVVQVAGRVWSNPEGYLQEAAGPFSGRRSDRADGIYLTEAELAVVRRYRTTARVGLWTLPTTRSTVADTAGYVPVVGTDNLLPWY